MRRSRNAKSGNINHLSCLLAKINSDSTRIRINGDDKVVLISLLEREIEYRKKTLEEIKELASLGMDYSLIEDLLK